MDNLYLLDLINEANSRGGGMVLTYENKPAAVVLTIDKYNSLATGDGLKVTGQGAMSATDERPISQTSQTTDEFLHYTSAITENRKVLVTGGAGYIGGHLVRELVKLGYEVVVLDNLSTGKLENLDPAALFIEGDLADENLLADIFATNTFEAVFHMAASLEVEESVREPQKYFSNNVANTYNLLLAMNEANCKKIIFSSTAAVYGSGQEAPITETSPLHPQNPYGQSKLLAERIIKYYCENLGFQAVVFRYFNACGFDVTAKILPTHQSHLIYNVIQVAKGSRSALMVFGNDYETFDGTGVRDYVHVLDIVLPHILALKALQSNTKFEIYNIGTGKGSSVAQVVSVTSEVLNKIIPMDIAPRRTGDAAMTVADNSKLTRDLQYTLQFSDLQNIIKTSWEVMKDM